MKKLVFLLISLIFFGCATYPPPAVANQEYKIGDELRITTPKGNFADVVVVDVRKEVSTATGETNIFYRLKEERFYLLPAGDPMLGPRPKEKKK